MMISLMAEWHLDSEAIAAIENTMTIGSRSEMSRGGVCRSDSSSYLTPHVSRFYPTGTPLGSLLRWPTCGLQIISRDFAQTSSSGTTEMGWHTATAQPLCTSWRDNWVGDLWRSRIVTGARFLWHPSFGLDSGSTWPDGLWIPQWEVAEIGATELAILIRGSGLAACSIAIVAAVPNLGDPAWTVGDGDCHVRKINMGIGRDLA